MSTDCSSPFFLIVWPFALKQEQHYFHSAQTVKPENIMPQCLCTTLENRVQWSQSNYVNYNILGCDDNAASITLRPPVAEWLMINAQLVCLTSRLHTCSAAEDANDRGEVFLINSIQSLNAAHRLSPPPSFFSFFSAGVTTVQKWFKPVQAWRRRTQ